MRDEIFRESDRKTIIEEVEKKVKLLGETKKTIDKVLITTIGASKDLLDMNYFSHVITLEELFKSTLHLG
jgi:hypothetical protein